MSSPDRRILLWLALWGALLAITGGPLASTASAHEGGPRLILLRPRYLPGETMEVTGANLGTDLTVRLELTSDTTTIVLGEALCDGHGDFTTFVTLPDELPLDEYTLRVLDSSVEGEERVIAASTLRVSDSPVPSTILNPAGGDNQPLEIPRYVYPLLLAAGCLAIALVSTFARRASVPNARIDHDTT